MARFPPAIVPDNKSNVSLLGESINRLLHTNETEPCQDPLVQVKCRELTMAKQRELTPKRFPDEEKKDKPGSSTAAEGYTKHR